MSNRTPECSSRSGPVHRSGNGATLALDPRQEASDLRKQLLLVRDAAARQTMMLREGDHRIKNSLQIVASLISEQARHEASDSARGALLSAAARIRSIALIHDALQEFGGADTVDLGAVLRAMCESLRTMAASDGYIAITTQMESVQTPVAIARPLVLAVNELVVNALRHAFPERDAGVVRVCMVQRQGGLSIEVADDGVGLPGDYDLGLGYGTRLIGILVRQVGGTLNVDNTPGATFTIHVPAAASPPLTRALTQEALPA